MESPTPNRPPAENPRQESNLEVYCSPSTRVGRKVDQKDSSLPSALRTAVLAFLIASTVKKSFMLPSGM